MRYHSLILLNYARFLNTAECICIHFITMHKVDNKSYRIDGFYNTPHFFIRHYFIYQRFKLYVYCYCADYFYFGSKIFHPLAKSVQRIEIRIFERQPCRLCFFRSKIKQFIIKLPFKQ